MSDPSGGYPSGGGGGGLSGLIASLFGGGNSSLSNLASNAAATTAFPNISNDIAAADAQSIASAADQPPAATPWQDTGQPAPAAIDSSSSTPDNSAAQQFSTILQQQGGTGQGQPPVAAATGQPGPGKPAPGQGQPEPWNQGGPPLMGQRQPPPGYQAIPPGTPQSAGGPPPQAQASPGLGGGGGGGGGTPQMSAPQGLGGQGNLGGAAGMPLPALVDALLRQMQGGGGQRYPIYRNPGMMRNVIGRERPGISGQRGNFSGQNNRPYGVTSRPGSGWPPPRANYFQHAFAGQQPPGPNQMQRINTPAGQIMAHPMVAHDIDGFTRDLRANGFPFERQWGSYNRRRMRWGPEWSSHAWGSAFDINDRDGPLSPGVSNWIRNHQQLWNQLKWKWNMGQPLAGPDGISGKDPAHVEWMGPRQQDGPQQGQPPTPDGTMVAHPSQQIDQPQPAAATGPIPQAYPWGQGPGYTPDASGGAPPPAQPWQGGGDAGTDGGGNVAMA